MRLRSQALSGTLAERRSENRRMTRREALRVTAGACVGLILGTGAALSKRLFPADGVDAYTIFRDGRPVGKQIITFSRESGRFVARIEINVRYAIGEASNYHYTHNSEERWKDAWLDAVVSDTRDNGMVWRVRAQRENQVFKVKTNRSPLDQHITGYLIPSSLWHRDTPFGQALFDCVEGRLKRVGTSFVGEEMIDVRGKTIAAKHFAMRGELQREVWYATDFTLVRAAMPSYGGSWVTFQLD